MTKKEFLEQLRESLQGEISAREVNDNINYYASYIDGEIGKGKAEAEVMYMLGDPRLIAKTIIETRGISGSTTGNNYFYEADDEDNTKTSKGFNANYDKNDSWDLRFGKLKLNTKLGRIISLLVVILIFAVVIVVVGQLVAFLLPVVLPIFLVMFILTLLRGGGRYQ